MFLKEKLVFSLDAKASNSSAFLRHRPTLPFSLAIVINNSSNS